MDTIAQWIIGIFLVILIFTSGCVDTSQNDITPITHPTLIPLEPDPTPETTVVETTQIPTPSPTSTFVAETPTPELTHAEEIIVPPSFGSIYVTSSPSGAKIICDGKNVGLAPITINDLSEGTHVLLVDLDGYKTSTVNVAVYANKVTEINVPLMVESVQLELIGSPSGASVFINDKYEGVLPLKRTLPKGEYTIKVSKDGYEDSVYHYNLQSDIHRIEFNLRTSPNPYGTLRVIGSPTDASVFVNGDYKGVIPLEITLPIGEYQLKVTKDGYDDYTRSFKLSSDSMHIADIKLKVKSTPSPTSTPSQDTNGGSLYIFSSPPGATIICDGKTVGITPITLNDLDAGIHSLSASMQGYKPLTQNVNVISGETTEAGFYLTPTFGYLEVITTPDGASIFIDGIYKGITPAKIELPIGGYTLKVIKDGYQTHTSYPIVSSGNTNTFEYTLYPIS